jgi:hypothetical protein
MPEINKQKQVRVLRGVNAVILGCVTMSLLLGCSGNDGSPDKVKATRSANGIQSKDVVEVSHSRGAKRSIVSQEPIGTARNASPTSSRWLMRCLLGLKVARPALLISVGSSRSASRMIRLEP